VVTGGAGFVGSHLVDRLLAEGTQVLVLDDLSTGRPENLASEAQLERLDIATDDIERVLRTWAPTAVYHLAAQASVVASQRDPLRDLEVNVIGTQRVATAALTAGTRRLVFTSSGGAVYGETRRAATERTLPAPSSYYGVHKLAAEGHIRVIGLPSAIARPSNIYGPRQTAGLEGAVIAAFVAQAAGGRLRIDGDGRQSRDFVHVRDVTDALWRLGQLDAAGGTWNVASGRRTSVRSLAETIERASGWPIERSYGPRREGDVMHSVLSSRHLRTALGWRPVVPLTEGIRELLAAAAGSPR
jgi:UDP-glucose 4-epimerase